MKLGFIGLGKMGSRIVKKLLASGHEVVVWNRSSDPIIALQESIRSENYVNNLDIASSIEELVGLLDAPKIVWSMLPAGQPTEQIFQQVAPLLSPQDILIDGGNAHFADTQRRFEELSKKGIRFLGVGVSGGIIAAENGYPLMAGGDKSAYDTVSPFFDSLSKPNGGYAYFGTGGAGHFVKMVHNGIEYGMMQSLGEGFGVLEKAPYQLDLDNVARLWRKGTIVSSFLLDRAYDALEKNPKLDDIEGIIDASGEALWTVEEAKKEDVPVPVIEKSLEFRSASKTDESVRNSFAARMVAALRREFGGHAVKEK
ncbi:MAG TPA: decarboxylating 6-phosphogluconate dehydrogenase [Patescibacteria group bacterium]|nr:decarboxylating 6-phosphogluconate dehydrogenase [Patescibacteria group bacterium]